MNELDLFAAAIAISNAEERAALLDHQCAGQAELRKKGRKVRRFEEGFPEWKVAGLPVETGQQPQLSSRARKAKR